MSGRDPHHIDVAIGARIRLMRNQRGLSQIALGHKRLECLFAPSRNRPRVDEGDVETGLDLVRPYMQGGAK